MLIEGTLVGILVDGYERFLTIDCSGKIICCSYVQFDEYLDSSELSKCLLIGSQISLPVRLVFVRQYELVDVSVKLGFIQYINEPSRTDVVGMVKAKKDTDSYLLSIGDGVTLEIDFESSVELDVGSRIRVKGLLATIQD